MAKSGSQGGEVKAEGGTERRDEIESGLLPVLPPGAKITVRRKYPMWAEGVVAYFTPEEGGYFTMRQAAQVQSLYGGGTYEVRATKGGQFIAKAVNELKFDGPTLWKGKPHPADPDREIAPEKPEAPSQGPHFVAGPSVHGGGPDASAALLQQMQWLQQQVGQLMQGHAPLGAPHATPAPTPAPTIDPNLVAQLQAAGYVVTPPQLPTPVPTFGSPTHPFHGAHQFMELVNAVREFDRKGQPQEEYEYEEDEEEEEDDEETGDTPKNLEEAIAYLVYSKAKEFDSEEKARSEGSTTMKLIRNGEVIETTATKTNPSGGGGGEASGIAKMVTSKLQQFPAEEQASLILEVLDQATNDPKVRAALQAIERKQKGA